MKTRQIISAISRRAGLLLIECLVYMGVFVILFGMGTAAFYVLWDNSAALIESTDNIAAALRAGEQWRADVRCAAGAITAEHTVEGETVRIPEQGGKEIIYRFNSGKIQRQTSPGPSRVLLANVKMSQMNKDVRKRVVAWRWELELNERRRQMHLPLSFTFEAAQPEL